MSKSYGVEACQADMRNAANCSQETPVSPSEEAALLLETSIFRVGKAVEEIYERASKLLRPEPITNEADGAGKNISPASKITNAFLEFTDRVNRIETQLRDIINRLE